MHISEPECLRPALFDRTFCSDGDVLYLTVQYGSSVWTLST